MTDSFSNADEALKHLSENLPTGDEYEIRLANSISEEGKTAVFHRLVGLFYLAASEADGDYTFYRYKRQTHGFDHEGKDYDPIGQVMDRKIEVTDEMIAALQAYHDAAKFHYSDGLAACLRDDERELLRQLANALSKRLIDALRSNPSKLWVIQQMPQAIPHVQWVDSVVRDEFAGIATRLMNIIGIKSSNGYFAYYLYSRKPNKPVSFCHR